MAGFADLVRNMVALADSMTDSLQATVTHYAWASATKDDSGKVTWGTGVVRKAIVETVHAFVKNQQGQAVLATTKLTFLRPVVFDSRDKFLLPDGRTAFVARLGSLVDPDTGTGEEYLTEVWLG